MGDVNQISIPKRDVSYFMQCQRINNPLVHAGAKELLREENPDVVFIMETKSLVSTIIKSRIFSNYDNISGVDCKGRSGGLILAQKSSVNLSILEANERFIKAKLRL